MTAQVRAEICATSKLTPEALDLQIALIRAARPSTPKNFPTTAGDFFACYDGILCDDDIRNMNAAGAGDPKAIARERTQWGLPKLKQP